MAETVAFEQSENEYLRASRAFVRALVCQLNATLVNSEIAQSQRKEICESFVRSLCVTLDQKWVRIEGQTYFPLLAFSKRFLNIGDTVQGVAPIEMPTRDVAFLEMLGFESDWLFEECGEVPPDDVCGYVGEERPDVEPPAKPAYEKIRLPCNVCSGTGKCFCIRKGSGVTDGCPRCSGSGQCKHCIGTGFPKIG